MIKIFCFLLALILLLPWGCSDNLPQFENYHYRIPKVLFLTTGDGRGEGTVSDGAIIALQAFNRRGAFVRFENRTVLWDENNLADYDIIVGPTAFGYHDADRMFSLTYMNNQELQILKKWIEKGGILIMGENFGRNDLEGQDRVALNGQLDSQNWVLGDIFPGPLEEIDIQGYQLSANKQFNEIYPNPLIQQVDSPTYLLLPSAKTFFENNMNVWFNWQDTGSNQSYPAVFLQNFGQGKVLYFSSFLILHPALDGGLSGTLQIETIYEQIYQLAIGPRKYPISLNPWPNAAQATLTITVNPGGTAEECKYLFTGLSKYFTKISFFINGNISSEILNWCKSQSQIEIQSNAFQSKSFRELAYFETFREIRMAENHIQKKSKGFRFPLQENNFWGMFLLDQIEYDYDSSIPAEHTRYYGGGIFPYNIPIFDKNGFFKSLDLLEISPFALDDKFFYKENDNQQNYPVLEQKQDAESFQSYLENFWQEVIIPERGIMTLIVHPSYAGRNQILLKPVLELAKKASLDNKFWLASLDQISSYWHLREKLQINIREENQTVWVNTQINGGGVIEGLTLELPSVPKNVRSKLTKIDLLELEDKVYLVFDAVDGEILEISF